MPLPLVLQRQDFGNRVVTTPALVSSRPWTAGDVWMDGTKAVHYSGLRDVGAGVQVNVVYVGIFEFPCATGVTMAKDADAFYDTVNRTIVAAGGANIILAGKLVNAKVGGQLTALVALNNM